MILNDIDDLISSAQTNHSSLLLGVMERRQMLDALRRVMGISIEPCHISSGNSIYRGFRIVPVDLPSYMALGTVGKVKTNSTVLTIV